MRPAHDDPVIRDPHVIASCRRGGATTQNAATIPDLTPAG